jgi:ATP-dependent Clp protease protease subunit
MKNNGIKKVNLLIQSGGGILTDGIAIYTYLKNLPIDISTYNCGFVGSIAILIYLTGNKRYASNLSKFMIHKSTLQFLAPTNIMDVKNRSEITGKDDKNIEEILKSKIKMPEDKWAEYKNADLFIMPDEALKFNLIHEISEFEPKQELPLINI